MKRVLLYVLIFCGTLHDAFAQSDMMVKSSDKGLYLDHKVAAKENFYSVGRLYNISAKEIAAFNKLDMAKGLNLGQTIRIPLTSGNFSQTVNEGTAIYYKTGEKEGLLKVSNAVNKVSLENLRRWNGLANDNVNFGTKLIVGFLVAGGTTVATVPEKKEPVVTVPIKTETVIKEPKKEEVVIKSEPKKEESVIKKEPVIEQPKTSQTTTDPGQAFDKAFFAQEQLMARLPKDETVTSGIFKTSSGWKDAKYYMLMDGVPSGTIVKVVNPDNSKVVYAKVLGQMSGIRQNEGFNIRISNAAAASLGIGETDKFIVKLNY